jgi:uncharacterized paraquat-inducible protein A
MKYRPFSTDNPVEVYQGKARAKGNGFVVKWNIALFGRKTGSSFDSEELATAFASEIKEHLRKCMCCDRMFRSEGFHNRLCLSCRTRGTDLG